MAKYCLDTSFIVTWFNIHYPKDIFSTLWNDWDKLVTRGDIIAPISVQKELEQGRDELSDWAKENKKIFHPHNSEIQNKVKDLLSKYPNLIDINKSTEDADPYIIAMAQLDNLTVLTCEVVSNSKKLKIPNACNIFNIRYINKFPDFFREMIWKY